MSRQTRFEYFRKAGFFINEARELSHISRTGMKAPYVVRMVASRRTLRQNADRYGWSDTRYRNEVKAIYIQAGAIKYDVLGRSRINVWQMLRDYEDRVPEREAYESPWRKRLHVRSIGKKDYKYTTRKKMYQDWISQLERNLANATTDARKTQLRKQITNLREAMQRLNK